MPQLQIPDSDLILQVAENDFEKAMTRNDAQNAFKALGEGWRLPIIEELQLMHRELYQKGLGNFKHFYRSSDCVFGIFPKTFYFERGKSDGFSGKSGLYRVRPVRTVRL